MLKAGKAANANGTRNMLHDALMSGDLAIVQARIAAVRQSLGKPVLPVAVDPADGIVAEGATRDA